jgi:transposase-like protein
MDVRHLLPLRQKSNVGAESSKQIVKGVRPVTRKSYSAEVKIRIVLDGLRGEMSITELSHREGISGQPVSLRSIRQRDRLTFLVLPVRGVGGEQSLPRIDRRGGRHIVGWPTTRRQVHAVSTFLFRSIEGLVCSLQYGLRIVARIRECCDPH